MLNAESPSMSSIPRATNSFWFKCISRSLLSSTSTSWSITPLLHVCPFCCSFLLFSTYSWLAFSEKFRHVILFLSSHASQMYGQFITSTEAMHIEVSWSGTGIAAFIVGYIFPIEKLEVLFVFLILYFLKALEFLTTDLVRFEGLEQPIDCRRPLVYLTPCRASDSGSRVKLTLSSLRG